MKQPSLVATTLCAFVIVLLSFYRPRWENQPGAAVINYDVFGYYTYLPGAFIYNDLSKLNWVDSIVNKYGTHGAIVNYTPAPTTGNRVIKYSSGLAIMYAPFFGIAHFLAKPLGFEADGFSKPYQVAIAFGGLLMAVLGLFIARKILRRYFSETTTATTILALAFGTNWHHYARFDYAHSHIWLFTLYAALIWQTIRFYEKADAHRAVSIGLLVGLAALTRPTDAVSAFIPLLWGVMPPFFGKNGGLAIRLAFLKNHWKLLLVAVIAAALIGSIQLIYWKLEAGEWLFYSYGDQKFSFLRPHLVDGLFSAKKGWLVYTPIMLFALLGFYQLKKLRPELFLAALVFAAINIWIVLSWDVWWYGGSFGQRAMIQGYAVLIFPLAAFIDVELKNTRKPLWSSLVGFCVFLNLFQSWQPELTGMGLDAEGNTPAFYRRMFLRFKPDMNDLKLQDGKDDFGNLPRHELKMLYETGFEDLTDSTFVDTKRASSGQKSAFSDGNREFVPISTVKPENEWVRLTARFFTTEKEWESWRGTAVVLEAKDSSGKTLRSAYHRPMRYLETWRWKELFFDLKLKKLHDVDRVEIYLWQPLKNSKTLWIDDVQIESFKAYQ